MINNSHFLNPTLPIMEEKLKWEIKSLHQSFLYIVIAFEN